MAPDLCGVVAGTGGRFEDFGGDPCKAGDLFRGVGDGSFKVGEPF